MPFAPAGGTCTAVHLQRMLMKKDPNKIVRPGLHLDTLYRAMKDSLKKPYIGVTQGGSSRKNAGARVAAVNSKINQPKDT